VNWIRRLTAGSSRRYPEAHGDMFYEVKGSARENLCFSLIHNGFKSGALPARSGAKNVDALATYSALLVFDLLGIWSLIVRVPTIAPAVLHRSGLADFIPES